MIEATTNSTQASSKADESSRFDWILTNPRFRAFDVFLFGMTIVIGGQNYSWNIAYTAGFWITFLCAFVTGIGYLCLCLCMAEMTSALPFSGGIYGFVRAFSSPYFGFLIACFELVMNIFYISATVYPLAVIPYTLGYSGMEMQLVYCFITYVFMLLVCMSGGKIFWTFSHGLGLYSLLIILIYIFGSINYANYPKWASENHSFTGNDAIKYLQSSSWLYIGIQYAPLASKLSKDPRKDVPRGMITCMISLILTGLTLTALVCSQQPGIFHMATDPLPLTHGLQHTFQISEEAATLLNIPSLLATNLGFLYCYGKQAASISKSGLLPSLFQYEIPKMESPIIALLIGSLFSFMLNIIAYYSDELTINLTDITSLASYFIYLSAFYSYYLFKTKYSTLNRSFVSPLGNVGALIGTVIFLASIVSVVGFQGSNRIPIICCVGFFVVISVYYFAFMAKKVQFSEEEKDQMFKAYLINGKFYFRSYEIPFYYYYPLVMVSESSYKEENEEASPISPA